MVRARRSLISGLLILSLAGMTACGTSSSTTSSGETTSTTVSTVTVSPGTVDGGKDVTVTVTLTGPAPSGGVAFTVTALSLAVIINYQILYNVRAGQSSFTFKVQTLPVGSPDATLITVTTTLGQIISAPLILQPTNPLQLTGFTVSANTVTSGGTINGSIQLNAPAYSPGQRVVVVSSDSAVAPVSPVTVPTGTSRAGFSIYTQPINSQRTVTLTASLNDTTMTTQLTLTPAGTAITALYFTPASLAGGQSATGFAIITPPAPAAGATISLSVTFSNPATPEGTPIPFMVPATVMVPAGATQVSFTATTTSVTTTTDLIVTAILGTTGAAFNVEVVPAINLTAIICNPSTLTGGNTGMPGNSANCTVSLSLPAGDQGLTVQLTSSDSTTLPVPAMVMVMGGQSSAPFTVTAGSPTTITTVTITGTLGGPKAPQVTTTVLVIPAGSVSVTSLNLNPFSILGGPGANSMASLTISNPAPPGGAMVSLTSSDTNSAQVPASVIVPPNTSTASFTITTSAVTAQANVTITAMLNTSAQTATLLVVPPPVLTGLSLTATSVAGGSTVTATVILASAAPAGPDCAGGSLGVCVTLTASSKLVQIVPNVTVPAGSTTATFLVTTLPVSSAQVVTITATLGTVSQQVILTLTLPVADIRLLAFNPPTVLGGNNATGIVTLTSPAPAAGTTVTLTSGNAAVVVPATVTVPAGQITATFVTTTTTVSTSTSVGMSAAVISAVPSSIIVIPAPTGTASEQLIAVGSTNSTDFPTQACPTSVNNVATTEFCGPLASGEDAGFVTSINQSTPASAATTSSLTFSSLVGNSTFGQVRDVHLDSTGNVFACGVTSDQNLPTTSTAAQPAYGGGNTDAFIVEFSPSGALLYLSYLGGSGDESCFSLTEDTVGHIYLSGSTTDSTAMNATNLMGTSGALQINNAGGNDFFVADINPTASAVSSRIVWLTLVGGSADDFADGRIAISTTGSLYVTGSSRSVSSTPPDVGFPTPSRPPLNGVGTFGVVLQLTSDGGSIISSTFIFGRVNGANPGVLTTTTASGSVAFDVLGNAYVCGQTNASDLPVSSGAFQPNLMGQQNAYVARLTTATGLVNALTYLGGTGSAQSCRGLAVDSEHNPVVVVPTDAADYPATQSIQSSPSGPVAISPATLSGPSDVAITKLSSDLSTMIFSTLIGGTGSESGAGWAPGMPGDTTRILLDTPENMYFSVPTTSTNFPITSNALYSTPPTAGNQKVAIVKLASDGSNVLYGTYLGGSATNTSASLAYRHN
ncbi:MAG TPA: hypothetical protein VL099_14715 [Candidatus Binatia bacterium]|nr:hypothetical protein [Candidatus Binatia bacterium]